MPFGRRRPPGEPPRISCKDSALASLGRRALTRSELTRRLAGKGYTLDEVTRTVEALVARGLVNDAATAASHVRSRGARGLGKRRVAAELVARGIPEVERDAALAGIDADGESARLWAALEKRERSLPAGLTREVRSRKLLDHLVRRGFSFGAVLEALKRKGEPVDVDK